MDLTSREGHNCILLLLLLYFTIETEKEIIKIF
jgi:hypothetical protein